MESDTDYQKLSKNTFPKILAMFFFTGAPNFWTIFFGKLRDTETGSYRSIDQIDSDGFRSFYMGHQKCPTDIVEFDCHILRKQEIYTACRRRKLTKSNDDLAK